MLRLSLRRKALKPGAIAAEKSHRELLLDGFKENIIPSDNSILGLIQNIGMNQEADCAYLQQHFKRENCVGKQAFRSQWICMILWRQFMDQFSIS